MKQLLIVPVTLSVLLFAAQCNPDAGLSKQELQRDFARLKAYYIPVEYFVITQRPRLAIRAYDRFRPVLDSFLEKYIPRMKSDSLWKVHTARIHSLADATQRDLRANRLEVASVKGLSIIEGLLNELLIHENIPPLLPDHYKLLFNNAQSLHAIFNTPVPEDKKIHVLNSMGNTFDLLRQQILAIDTVAIDTNLYLLTPTDIENLQITAQEIQQILHNMERAFDDQNWEALQTLSKDLQDELLYCYLLFGRIEDLLPNRSTTPPEG